MTKTSTDRARTTLLDRYRAVAEKLDVLPVDEFIADQWRCDPVTPGRMRSKLKAEGFAFTRRNGVWYVAGRPGKAKIVDIPSATTAQAPHVNGNGVQQQLVIPEPVALTAVLSNSDDGTAVQLALIHQEMVKLNTLLAMHFQERHEQWQAEPRSVW